MKKIYLLGLYLVFFSGAFAQPICDLAIPIQCGDVVMGDSTAGPSNANNANNYGCLFSLYGSGSGGPERVYKLMVTQTATYRFVLDILNGTDLDIVVLRPQQLPCTFNNLSCPGGGFSYEYNMSYGVYREVLDIRLEANPTVPYYIFIDGKANPMPGSIVGRFNFSVDCTCSSIEASNDLPTGEAIFCDDFENYVADKVLEPQSTRWEHRDSTLIDGTVTSAGFTGKGAHFQGTASTTPDEFFLLRDRYSTSQTAGQTTGRYRMSWKMRVENGKKGYYSVAHQSPVGIVGGTYNMAYHINLLETGVGELRLGSNTSTPVATFAYPPGTWMNVVQIVDIDANKAELWINNNFVHSWAFNIGDNGISTRLAAINFKAANGYDFKIDELCIWRAISPCNAPPGPAILVENGVTYASEAAARCGLYTSLEWGDGYSLCQYGGTFIHRGDQYFGTLDNSDFAPSLLRSDPCVQSAYGNNVPFPLYADIYIFYKDDDQIADVIFNDNGNPTMRQFVFSCNYVNSNGDCQRGQQCLTEIGSGTYLPNTCDSFYYVVVTSGQVNDDYDLSIIPQGLCGSNYENVVLDCSNLSGGFEGQTILSDNVGNTSNFNAVGAGNAYEGCYNGNRTYNGGEKIYQFILENPALLTFQLDASSPMGLALYSFVCANECIAFEETNAANQLTFKQPLLEGTYFLVIDKSVNDPATSFDLTIYCRKKTFFDIQSLLSCDRPGEEISQDVIGRVPPICITCLIPSNSPADNHKVIINNQGQFSNFDQMHFLFRDSLSGYLVGSPALSSTWDVGSTLPKEFMLPEDYVDPVLGLDSLQCSYKDGEVLYLYLTQSANGNHQFRELIPTFAPVGFNGANGGGIFSAGKTSIVSHIELGSPVTWYSNTTTLEAPNSAINRSLKFDANIPWTVDEVPDAPWLTLSDTYGDGDGLYDLNLAFSQNTSLLPRTTTLRFVSTEQPDVYRLYVIITQLPPCTPPQVEIVTDNTGFCEGDSIFLRADVGTDPVSGNSLAPLYTFEWQDMSGSTVFPGLGVPADQLGLLLSSGPYTYSVIAENKYCDGLDTDGLDFTVTLPPTPPTPNSPTSRTICTDDPIPSFSVNTPPGGQIIRWYSDPTGGSPIFTGTTFTPTLKETGVYYAGTQVGNGGCESTSRVAFSLTVNALPTFQETNKSCTEDHLFYNFTINTNGGSVTVNGAPITGSGGVFQVTNVPIANAVTVRVANPNCDTIATVTPPMCTCAVNAPGFIQNYSFCENAPLPISVTINQPNVVVDWYDAPTGGNKINTVPANPFQPITPYLPVYYAQAKNILNNCVSSRTAVQVTVKLQPTLVLTDTTCTAAQDFYSISVTTNGNNATSNSVIPSFAGGIYTFSMIPAGQPITITTQNAGGCSRVQTINAPNCACLNVAAPVSDGDATICFGEPFPELSVTVGPNQTANWYLNNIQVASNSTTYFPQTPGVYQVETFDPGLNCTSSGRTSVQLSEFPEIQYSVSPVQCAYNRQTYGFTISAGTGTSVTVNGIMIPGNNGNFAVNNITVGANAQIVVTNLTTLCTKGQTIISPSCPCVEVINQPGTIPSNGQAVCQGQPKTLTVTLGNDQTANWYNEQGILVGQGLSYTPSTQTPGPYTYSAEAYNFITDCVGSNRRFITFTVLPSPTLIATKDCENQGTYFITATVTNANTVTSTAGTVTDNGGGIFTITGILLSQSVQLTALNTITGCSAQFTVSPPASCDCGLLGTINPPMAGADQKACVGQPFPFLTAQVNQPNVVVDWYDPNGVLLLQNNSMFPPPGGLLPGIYTYYAEARNSLTNCTSDNRVPVKITVSALPSLLLSDPLCEASYLTYKVQGQTEPGNMVTANPGTVNNLPGGFFEVTGITLGQASTITVVNQTTTCQTSATAFLATCPCPQVNVPISNGDKTMCAGSPTAPLLSVNVSNPTTETVDWFDAATGGNLLGTGTMYQPSPPPVMTTSYFAQARLASPNIFCPSIGRREVQLEVRPRPEANAGLDQTICASDTLTLSGIITGVNGGFWAANGGQFIPDNGAFTAQQYVPAADATQVTLTLVTDPPGGPCLADSDEMLLTLLAAPVIDNISVDCAPDFQSYSVLFSSNTNILNTIPGPPTPLPNGQYQVLNIPIGQNLSITGFNTSTSCDRKVTVPSPAPCPCPVVAQPVSTLGNNISVCAGTALPTLIVQIPNGTIANWYLAMTGGQAFLENTTEYTPTLPGDYYVEAVNSLNNCASARTKITISIKPTPIVFIGPDNSFCPGNSVTITADAGSGYTYLWSTGQSGQTISVGQPGLYQVTVTLNGCTAVDSFQIIQNPALMADITISDSLECFGQENGKLTAVPTGGALPATAYFWSNQSGLPTITGLGAGTYTVTIVDQNGCTATDVQTLDQPPAIAFNNLIIQNSSNGAANGSISGQVSGGVPPYQFQWHNQDSLLTGQTESAIDSIPAGNYFLAITDANGCTFNSPPINIVSVGADEPGLEQFIQLFPNPTTGLVQVRFNLPKAAMVEIKVLDVLGQVIFSNKPASLYNATTTLDLSPYAKGLYWVKIRLDESIVVKKVSVFR